MRFKNKLKYSLLIAVFSGITLFAQQSAVYTISVTTYWNSTDHSDNGNTPLPSSAHWSDLVGATHSTANEFFEVGTLATPGIEDVAEIGVNTAFKNEVDDAITNGLADQWLQQGFSPTFGAIGTASLGTITVSENYPLLTLVSMIAPSPDWFIGVNSFSLLDTDNNWKTGEINIDVFAYDAGTEDGTTYTITNAATNPHEPISSLVNIPPFNNQKLATLTISFVSSLSVDDESLTTSINLYPNPTSDILYVYNPGLQDDLTIEVYDVLGKIAVSESNTSTIDVSFLNAGSYFAKITSSNKLISTRKIIKL